MRIKNALQISGLINIFLALTMTIPLAASIAFKDSQASTFIYSSIITALTGIIFFFSAQSKGGAKKEIGNREGFVIVAFSWITVALFSSVPFILSGSFDSITDAVFEATSGITTTGASILNNIESMPKSIILWRSFIHWLGGLGIVLLGLAILPLLGIGGMQLYKAEASVVSSEKFAPRVREMARILLTVYLGFTALMMTLLYINGLGLYDSFIHTVGSVATAGFSSKTESIGYFNSVRIEVIVMVFMVLGATNFSLHYNFFQKGIKAYTQNEEFRFYVSVMVIATLIITLSLNGVYYDGFFQSLRYGTFQVVSIVTTTGFSSTDFGAWPEFSQTILLILMFFGGSAGSTTGAIKCVRMLLLIKYSYKEMYRLIHPHAVTNIKLNGKTVPPEVLKSVTGFALLFFIIFVVSTALLSSMGLDFKTAISSSIATLGNIGPALGAAGPGASYSFAPDGAKWLMTFNMLLGRLELYTLIILLVPAFWRE